MRVFRLSFLAIGLLAAAAVPASAAPPQSPVDVIGGTNNIALPELDFDYPVVDLTMKTYNLPADPAEDHPAKKKIEGETDVKRAAKLTVSGITYYLANIHFHAAAEHTDNGIDPPPANPARYPMEMHMVHFRDAGGEGNQAALAVGRWIIVTDNESEYPYVGANPRNHQLNQMLDNLPPIPPVIDPDPNTAAINNFDLSGLLPPVNDRATYRYNGSLTTFTTNAEKNANGGLGVSETPVKWIFFDEPLLMTQAQINKFTGHAATTGFRTVQNITGDHNLMTDVYGVPEPSTLWLLAVAGIVAGLRRRR